MATSRTTPLRIKVDALPGAAVALLDDMLMSYVEWHEQAEAVSDAYADLSASSRVGRELRYAAYVAALDQEETAARAYADSIARLERWLTPA